MAGTSPFSFPIMPQIALLVETALGSGRQILRGVSHFVYEREDWEIFHYTGSLGAMVPDVLRNWDGDGIIARINNEETLSVIESRGLPVIDVLGNYPGSPFPRVLPDNEAISKMVLDHLRSRGFASFGFFGVEGEQWSHEREKAFVDYSNSHGFNPVCFKISHAQKRQLNWDHYQNQLCEWLLSLNKPTGIFACSDQFGPDLIQACRLAKLHVPEDVALVGVDNDLAFCEVVRPSLSSVRPNHTEVGYIAASLLTEVIEKGEKASEVTRIPPQAIEIRQSSDVFALEDQGLKKALLAIKEGACEGIGVDEVSKISGYSRSVLQRKVKKELGRTVHELLHGARISRAKQLLEMTDLPISEVAQRSGFNHQEYLGMVLKKESGYSPAQFRKLHARVS